MSYDAEAFQKQVQSVLKDLEDLLIVKNRSYGNSFAEPVNIFAKGLPKDALIRIRLDDKLSRITNGTDELNEDTVQDIMGYFVLWEVLKRRENFNQLELPGIK